MYLVKRWITIVKIVIQRNSMLWSYAANILTNIGGWLSMHMLPSWYQVCHNVGKDKVFIYNERRWYIWKWCWIVKMSMILGKIWKLFDRTHCLGFITLNYRPILGPSTQHYVFFLKSKFLKNLILILNISLYFPYILLIHYMTTRMPSKVLC
jgi:hypothetical protein